MSNSKMWVSSWRDEPVELIGGFVNRQHHPIALRLGKREDAFGDLPRDDVLLLELAMRLEDDQGDPVGQVVCEIGADLVVGTLGVAGHPL